jgi:hypothetical protein
MSIRHGRARFWNGSALVSLWSLTLLQRAQPFPPPPPELAGSEMKVPLRFNIR